ncbi:MAG: hypothetical protein IT264_08520 [Saprospiraceae bacterium]|nr:hypothetical protein [Saprospiraceae bacterium]
MTSLPKDKVPHSRIFERFRNIPVKSYYDHVSFFARYSKEIDQLPFEESVEIKMVYLKALFFLERTKYFQNLADNLVQEILNQETFEENHKRIYSEILELKAQLFISQRETEKAINLYSELNRMNSENVNIREKLFSLILSKNLSKLKKPIALVILLLIITISLAICSSLFIKPIYPNSSLILEWIYTSAFLVAVLTLFGTYIIALIRSKESLKSINQLKKGKKIFSYKTYPE